MAGIRDLMRRRLPFANSSPANFDRAGRVGKVGPDVSDFVVAVLKFSDRRHGFRSLAFVGHRQASG